MKLLVVSPELPLPPEEGGHHVIENQIRVLRELGHAVSVYSWVRIPNSSVAHLPPYFYLQKKNRNRTPTKSSRVLRLYLKEEAFGESYYYGSLELSELLPRLEDCDAAIFHLILKKLPRRLRDKCFVHFLNYESALYRLRVPISPWPQSLFFSKNGNILEKHERELMQWAKESWFVSHADFLKSEKIAKSPRFVPPHFPVLSRTRGSSSGRPLTIGFIGGMNFKPNVDSVAWLIQTLAPALKKRGFGGEFLIRRVKERLRALQLAPSRFRVVGH